MHSHGMKESVRRSGRFGMLGFFEGIDSERGIAWRVADSLSLRQFLQIGLDEQTPDHVTISRTRRLMDEPTHQEVFNEAGGRRGLPKGRFPRHAPSGSLIPSATTSFT